MEHKPSSCVRSGVASQALTDVSGNSSYDHLLTVGCLNRFLKVRMVPRINLPFARYKRGIWVHVADFL